MEGMGRILVYVVVLAVAVIATLVLIRYLRINAFNPEGKGAERHTTGILKRFGRIRGFRTLTDVHLSAGGKSAWIENMLIGYFGILLVRTVGRRGEIYGELDSATWTIVHGESEKGIAGKRVSIPNPLQELQQAAALLRAVLSKNKVYNIPIECVVYITNKSKQTQVFVTNSGEVLLPGKLSGYLGKAKFEKDTGLDIGRIAGILEAEQAQANKNGAAN